MARKNKKRNKQYSGEDAKTTGVAGQNKPVVHRYEAKQRSQLGLWFYERKKLLKTSLIVVGVVTFVVIIIIGLVQSF